MVTAPALPVSEASPPPPRRGWYKRNEIALTPWLFLLPGILFFAVYVIAPIFQSFWISFHE
jgi:multiple sugar transport system permease protein